MARRRFSKEYKQEAVSLVQQSDIPVAEIARNLGLNDNVHCLFCLHVPTRAFVFAPGVALRSFLQSTEQISFSIDCPVRSDISTLTGSRE